MPDLNVCSRSIAVVAGRAMQTFRSQVSPLLHMIVEEIGIVLGADLFVGLLLHAPIAPHSGRGSHMALGSSTLKMNSIAPRRQRQGAAPPIRCVSTNSIADQRAE